MAHRDKGAKWDRIEQSRPDNFTINPVDPVEAMKHLDPAGAFAGLDLDDYEGMAFRAALDMIGAM